MNKPREHAAIIKAWADGAEVEFYSHHTRKWELALTPSWSPVVEYRLKPEKKPDTVCKYFASEIAIAEVNIDDKLGNLLLFFDGRTGKLKDAEVLE